jgi:cysteinyl-tRNA synthetase
MSKSKGGFVTLGTLEEEGFEPLDYRYFCLGGHYRSQLQFSYDALVAARRARLNLLERIGVLEGEVAGGDGNGTAAQQVDEQVGAVSKAAQEYLRRFEQHVAKDLNTPKALAELWSLIKDETVAGRDKLSVIARMDRVLGLKLLEEKVAGTPEELDEELQALIRERAAARKERNFARADEIRDTLVQRGIVLEDTPQGTRWKKV